MLERLLRVARVAVVGRWLSAGGAGAVSKAARGVSQLAVGEVGSVVEVCVCVLRCVV